MVRRRRLKGEGQVSGAYWQFHCLLDIHSYKGADWGQSTTLCNISQTSPSPTCYIVQSTTLCVIHNTLQLKIFVIILSFHGSYHQWFDKLSNDWWSEYAYNEWMPTIQREFYGKRETQLFEMASRRNIQSHFWAFNIQCNIGSKLEHLTKIFFLNTFFHRNNWNFLRW